MPEFFNIDTLPTASMDGKSDLAPKIHDCKRCGLFSECSTPKFPYSGAGKKRILIIGPPVGRIEDESEGERKSSSYKYLANNLKQVGIDLEEDCWYTHAIRCYTKSNIGLTTQSACHRMLMREIDELDPIVIVPADPEAWNVLLYERLTGRASYNSYFDWCGELIPDQVLLRWVAPVYSASFVDGYNDKQYNPYILFWHKQMENMLIPAARPKKIDTYTHVCKNVDDARSMIGEALSWSSFAFDYETTGIKPYAKGHKIAYISISDGEVAYSFPNFSDVHFQENLKSLLTNDAIKIAHNANFERSWTKEILGYEVNNLIQDTMILQHCLNNRKPAGLKFLTYARYGYLGYDADADEYLRASTDDERAYGTNAFNRVFDAPVSKILQYNALDSLFTAWLFKDLYQELDRVHQLPGYKFFMEGSITFANMHEEGISVDIPLLEKTGNEIEAAIRPFIDEVMADSLIVEKWRGSRVFNPRSDHDIRTLLFSLLKLEPIEFTDKGLPSVDAESLDYYRSAVSVIEPLFQIKRLGKLYNTYVRQIRREHNSGKVHCFFNLHKVATGRSSCDAINMQNQPKRDKESKRIIRSLFLPKRGHFFEEIDLKGAEVSIAATVTGDKNLIKYVSDPSTDMHRDLAQRIFMVDDVSKNLRGTAIKGPFTFAEFYGSYYPLVAKGIWREINIPNATEFYGFDVVKHLRKCGIRSYEQWEKHIQEQERVLWEEFFPGYQQWRKETFRSFVDSGYIDYPNGFRYYGPASRNECLNAPIQGVAFFLNLWAMTNIDRELRRRELDTKLVLQIHDSQIYDIAPAEEEIVSSICHKWLIEKPHEIFPWISVPIMAEIEKGEVDSPWSSLKGAGFLKRETQND